MVQRRKKDYALNYYTLRTYFVQMIWILTSTRNETKEKREREREKKKAQQNIVPATLQKAMLTRKQVSKVLRFLEWWTLTL